MPDVLGLSGEGDVVVDELTPCNQQDCHCVVVETLVLINNHHHQEQKIDVDVNILMNIKFIDNNDGKDAGILCR